MLWSRKKQSTCKMRTQKNQHKRNLKAPVAQDLNVWSDCGAGTGLLLPGIVDPSLTQDPERDAHPSQELVSKLQVAGVPQIHPGKKSTGLNPAEWFKRQQRRASCRHAALTSTWVCPHLLPQHQTAALCSLTAASPANGGKSHYFLLIFSETPHVYARAFYFCFNRSTPRLTAKARKRRKCSDIKERYMMDGPVCTRGHGPSEGGIRRAATSLVCRAPLMWRRGKKKKRDSSVWKSMGLIVSAVGLNQSDACPAVLQCRSRKDRRRWGGRKNRQRCCWSRANNSAKTNLSARGKNIYKKMSFNGLIDQLTSEQS